MIRSTEINKQPFVVSGYGTTTTFHFLLVRVAIMGGALELLLVDLLRVSRITRRLGPLWAEMWWTVACRPEVAGRLVLLGRSWLGPTCVRPRISSPEPGHTRRDPWAAERVT
jgi:hypothetical protein